MLKKYNNISLCFGIPGLALQGLGFFLSSPQRYPEANVTAVFPLLLLLGTVFLLIGLAYYAKAKGQHPAWCLTAFLSIIGLIILACLRDKSLSQPQEEHLAGPGKPRTILARIVSSFVLFLVAVAVLVIIFKVALH